MAVLTVMDANNKEFTADTERLFRIAGDVAEDSKNCAGITDSMQKNRVAKLHDVEFLNSKGEAIDSEQVIKDAESGKVNIVALDVEMEATHSGENHNYCIYYQESMEKDCESFVNPFRKPVLKNHDSWHGEPMGRILQAWHGDSKLTDDRSAIHLKTRITDKESIPKFLDGRYGTVSISGTMGTVTCNICGKTLLKDGKFKFCGHWRGETYKDKVCYWGAKDIEYHEVSTVNNPADDYAQIMKVTVLTDDDDKKDQKEEHDMAGTANGTATVTDAAKVKEAVSNIIDQMLGTSSTQASNTPEGTDAGASTSQDNTQTTHGEASDSSGSDDDRIKQLEQEVADKKAELEKVQAKLTQANDNIAKKEQDMATLQLECDSYKDKCMTLALANKELMVDNIIMKENTASDKIEERKNELMEKSAKELEALADNINSSTQVPEQRHQASVQPPTFGVDGKDARNDDDSSGNTDVKDDADTGHARKTVEDFANEIVGKLYK